MDCSTDKASFPDQTPSRLFILFSTLGPAFGFLCLFLHCPIPARILLSRFSQNSPLSTLTVHHLPGDARPPHLSSTITLGGPPGLSYPLRHLLFYPVTPKSLPVDYTFSLQLCSIYLLQESLECSLPYCSFCDFYFLIDTEVYIFLGNNEMFKKYGTLHKFACHPYPEPCYFFCIVPTSVCVLVL